MLLLACWRRTKFREIFDLIEESMKILGGIKFSIWSPVEVRKFSVAEITAPETYDEDGMPVQGGLMDNRLGTLEPGQKCGTCGNTSARCPGHFGHIELQSRYFILHSWMIFINCLSPVADHVVESNWATAILRDIVPCGTQKPHIL